MHFQGPREGGSGPRFFLFHWLDLPSNPECIFAGPFGPGKNALSREEEVKPMKSQEKGSRPLSRTLEMHSVQKVTPPLKCILRKRGYHNYVATDLSPNILQGSKSYHMAKAEKGNFNRSISKAQKRNFYHSISSRCYDYVTKANTVSLPILALVFRL